MRLNGKVAVITGAGSGFGEGIARTFAREGAAVVVNDVNDAAGTRVAEAILGAGGRAAYARADVTRDAEVKGLVDAAVATFGGLDIFVANAGWTHRNKPMQEVTEDEFDRIHAVNVKQLFFAARHAVPAIQARGGGSFIITASTAGLRPRPGLTWYNGSKGAAITIAKSMAVELAPLNIRVNALCPVLGQTGMTADFMGGDTPEKREAFLKTIPLGRMSTPDDIANAALFLASDEGAFITGTAFEIDGGRCV
ncbi:MAG TPA: glucose 1-dehydrogenase [Azospirillaceae bacterium]|nr:glucose 1-dehydrogenase [Azospirillaceae bacterium]